MILLTDHSPDDLLAEYHRIDDYLSAEDKKYAEFKKPHLARLQEIEGELHRRLLAMNEGKPEGKRASISTDHGTAYLSTINTPKWIDKTAGLDWCLEHWEQYGAMLQIMAPQKAALQEYQDANNGALPPFVEVTPFVKCNIRRS